jgi:predicted PurR-regulated permease PerM
MPDRRDQFPDPDPTTERSALTASGVAASVSPGLRIASEWTWRLGIVAVGIYLLSRIFAEFADIFIPVMIALLVTAVLYPGVVILASVMPRGLASFITLIGTLLVVVALFALVGQQTVSGFPELRDQAVQGLTKVEDWLATSPLHLSSSKLSTYVDQAGNAASDNKGTIVTGALGVAATASHLAEGFFITMFSTFFFLYSGQRIWAWLLRMFPKAARSPLDDAARSGWVTLTHYVRATLIVAFVDGVGIGVGAAVLGVPLALPLGVIVFLGAFVPVVGAVLTGLLAVLVALVANGPFIALAVLGVVIAVNQLEAHVMQPFLLGRAVSVHPLAVILAIATGASLAGIMGALFAVPVAAVANTMISSLAGGPDDDPGEEVARDDAPLSPDEPAETDIEDIPDPQESVLASDPEPTPSQPR